MRYDTAMEVCGHEELVEVSDLHIRWGVEHARNLVTQSLSEILTTHCVTVHLYICGLQLQK